MIPLRWSNLRYMAESPAHYKYVLEHGVTPTPAMKFGSLVHALVLGIAPNSFVVFEGDRRGNKWKEFKAEHANVEIVTSAEWERAVTCADAVKTDPVCGPLLKSGLKEHRIEWEVNGRACAGTPDLNGDVLIDLKVTAMVNPARFPWHARKMGWHSQIAWYHNGVTSRGQEIKGTYIIAVTPKEPHLCVAYELTPETLGFGHRTWRSLFAQLRVCEESGEFPGYVQGIVPLDIEDEDVTLTIGGEDIDL